MANFTDCREFIEREILPTLSGWEDDYDLQGICEAVSTYDPIRGYVWRKEFTGPDNEDTSEYWDIVEQHTIKKAY